MEIQEGQNNRTGFFWAHASEQLGDFNNADFAVFVRIWVGLGLPRSINFHPVLLTHVSKHFSPLLPNLQN